MFLLGDDKKTILHLWSDFGFLVDCHITFLNTMFKDEF